MKVKAELGASYLSTLLEAHLQQCILEEGERGVRQHNGEAADAGLPGAQCLLLPQDDCCVRRYNGTCHWLCPQGLPAAGTDGGLMAMRDGDRSARHKILDNWMKQHFAFRR